MVVVVFNAGCNNGGWRYIEVHVTKVCRKQVTVTELMVVHRGIGIVGEGVCRETVGGGGD